jgi:hypothetical protein
MGLCRDFGSQIAVGCDHPMTAGSDSCHCEQCGVVCEGRFEACPSVWAQGPQVVLVGPAPEDLFPGPSLLSIGTNGHDRPASAANGQPPAAAEATVAPPPTTTPTPAAPPLPAEGPAASDYPSPPDPAPAADGTGAEAFRWFQNAFDALRQEVQGLRGALSQEQALVATLLESRAADEGPDPEALRILVDTAARKAVRRQAADLKTDVGGIVDGLRRDLDAVKLAQEQSVADLQASVAAVAEALAGASAALPAEINRRDSANRKAFRATLNEEMRPLIEVVAESVAQSDFELQALDRKIDKLQGWLSATLSDVAGSVAALAADRSAGGEPVAGAAGVPPFRPPLPRRAPAVGAAPARAARVPVTRSAPAATRRALPERPAPDTGELDAPGFRVLQRRQPPEG